MTLPTPLRRGAPLAAGTAGLLVGAIIVTAIGFIAGTGRLAGESDESKALRVLRADRVELVRQVGQIAAAERLDDLHRSAASADRTAEALRERSARLAVLDDRGVQDDAMRAHRAMIAVLDGFAELSAVNDKNLHAWDDGERQIVSALGDLDQTAAVIAAMDAEQPLRLDTRAVDASVEKTSAYLTTAAEHLARYEKRTARFRKKNRAKLQAAGDYRATVTTQMGVYQATRKELQQYVDDVKDFDTRIVAFRETLQTAKSRRQGVRSTLATLSPSPSVQGAHQRLIGVLDHAISATDLGVDLAVATQDLRDHGDVFTSAFDLPEYREFSSQSAQITTERDSAVAAWTAAINRHTKRLKHPKGAPERPVI